MKSTLYFALLTLFFLGCASASVKSHRDPNTDFSRYRRIVVMDFGGPSGPRGREKAANMLASQFVKRGYNVIERSEKKGFRNRKVTREHGLSESERSALRQSGVNAIVMGSVSQFDCYSSIERDPFFLDCYVSLSCKLVDLETNEPVWTANGSISDSGFDITDEMLLQKIVRQLSAEIPSPE